MSPTPRLTTPALSLGKAGCTVWALLYQASKRLTLTIGVMARRGTAPLRMALSSRAMTFWHFNPTVQNIDTLHTISASWPAPERATRSGPKGVCVPRRVARPGRAMTTGKGARHGSTFRTVGTSMGQWLCRVVSCAVAFHLTIAVPPLAAAEQNDAAPPAAKASAPDKAASGFWDRDTLTGDWFGVRRRLEDAGVTVLLQEQSEVWVNLAGGTRRGSVYTGLTTAGIAVDLEKAAGWTGARFFVNAFQIHGRGPSANLAGNLQTVSSLEATRDTKLYQLWLEQTLIDGRVTIRLGQEGANDQMMTSRYAALFVNASFGFPALPSVDLPSGAPNYPLATPFVRVQVRPTPRIALVTSVFNGDPAPRGTGDPQVRDRGGAAFRLNGHALVVNELWYSVNQEDDAAGLPGTYKLGAWYHSGRFGDQRFADNGVPLASPASSGVPRSHAGNFSVYGVVDQMVWRQPGSRDGGIGVFLLASGAPAGYNLVNLFAEAGINWFGPFAGRENDILGIGVAYLGISPAARRYGAEVARFTGVGSGYASHETAIEVTYMVQVAPWFMLQPDLQVVVNPGAGLASATGARPPKNVVITGLRATVVF